MNPAYALETAMRFNECINAGDLDGLASLMTDNHRLIDSAGAVTAGKDAVLHAWAGFFDAFPDYQNHFTGVMSADQMVKMTGYSTCSDERLDGPAIWTARVIHEMVVEWRVYDDTPENRAVLGI
jgi:ketosteroid isomerase-like protein